MNNNISYEYVRGLVEGEGSFTFSTSTYIKDTKLKTKVPAFVLKMHIRDKELIENVRNVLGLRNKIYEYHYPGKDGYKRGPQAILIVREFGQLKNIVIPFFYKRLRGNKAKQFQEWLEKIGSDPGVSKHFKFIYKIYKAGFYDKNPKYID